jgi:hypothetical protein
MGLARLASLSTVVALVVFGMADLTPGQLAMLRDPQGWEYTAVFDLHNGMHVNHSCLVQGQPSDSCRGTLKLTDDGRFVQDMYIHGQSVVRHGTYELSGSQITLKDELGTSDGPYNLEFKPDSDSLRMSMNSAGVLIGADLQLVNSSKKKKKPAPQPASS